MCMNLLCTSPPFLQHKLSHLHLITSAYCSALWAFRSAGDFTRTFQAWLEMVKINGRSSEEGAVVFWTDSSSHSCTCFCEHYTFVYLLAAFRRLVPPPEWRPGYRSELWLVGGGVSDVRAEHLELGRRRRRISARSAQRCGLWNGVKK